jgi:hypothetical protein
MIKPSKPIFQDKEGTMRVAIFKNKNIKGNLYPLICITAMRFPFKYCKKIFINPSEVEKLKVLLARLPTIERKEDKVPRKINEKSMFEAQEDKEDAEEI